MHSLHVVVHVSHETNDVGPRTEGQTQRQGRHQHAGKVRALGRTLNCAIKAQ